MVYKMLSLQAQVPPKVFTKDVLKAKKTVCNYKLLLMGMGMVVSRGWP